MTRLECRPTARRKVKVIKKRAASTMSGEINAWRLLFKYALERRLVSENIAKFLRMPKDRRLPTLPFDPDGGTREIDGILDATNKIVTKTRARDTQEVRRRTRALVFLLLYSGLRIGDAVFLKKSNVDLKTGRLKLRMEKTGEPVYVKLQAAAIEALQNAPPLSDDYWFWDAKQSVDSAVNCQRQLLYQVFKVARVLNGHPHRFRDTFAVALLLNGTDIRRVQKLLGHTALRTTEKHYSPWVRTMQAALDEETAKLHFGSHAPQPSPDTRQHALGDAKTNVLPFSRTKAG
jgi:integrase